MVDGNQNMVRVWGGGIYEYDIFYDICDGEFNAILLQDVMLKDLQNLVYWSGRTTCSAVDSA
jgi:hypothetical protein